MNRRFGFVAAAVALVACGELLLRFKVEEEIDPQTIDGQLTPCALLNAVGVPFSVQITAEEDFPEQDTDVEHIKTAKIRSLTLSITAASAEPDWDFLDTLELYAEADGLESKLLASIGEGTDSGKPIPANATTLDMDSAGLNLAPYIKANGGFTITSEATGCAPQQDATFDGELVLDITARPL